MRRPFWIVLACSLAASGCGSGGPFDYVPVSGTLKYEDGTPLGGLRLIFLAQDADPVGTAHPRPARANVDAQGSFDCVTSHKYGDGLIPGKHKVVLQIAPVQDGKPLVAEEYTRSETTPLEIDTADAPLEIVIPRP